MHHFSVNEKLLFSGFFIYLPAKHRLFYIHTNLQFQASYSPLPTLQSINRQYPPNRRGTEIPPRATTITVNLPLTVILLSNFNPFHHTAPSF